MFMTKSIRILKIFSGPIMSPWASQPTSFSFKFSPKERDLGLVFKGPPIDYSVNL